MQYVFSPFFRVKTSKQAGREEDAEWRMRSYFTIFSLRVAIRESATILAGYTIRSHGYFSFFIDPFNVCKQRKPRLGARAAWGQKNGAANRPEYCVKEKQTSLIDR